MSAALVVRGASVAIAGTLVLEDVSFEVARGEFICLVGPNGGGKTTLLKAVLGLLSLREGEIEVLGQPPGKPHKTVGYLPQSKAFAPNFPASVAELITANRLGAWPRRLGAEDVERARAVLARVGGEKLLHRPLKGLSGGETQRAFLARALVNDPQLLLLDEPTAGVDARGRAALLDLLAELAKGGRLSAVIVTHNQAAVRRLAARAVCLDRRIVASGPPASVLESTAVEGRDLGPGHDHAEPAVCEED